MNQLQVLGHSISSKVPPFLETGFSRNSRCLINYPFASYPKTTENSFDKGHIGIENYGYLKLHSSNHWNTTAYTCK